MKTLVKILTVIGGMMMVVLTAFVYLLVFTPIHLILSACCNETFEEWEDRWSYATRKLFQLD